MSLSEFYMMLGIARVGMLVVLCLAICLSVRAVSYAVRPDRTGDDLAFAFLLVPCTIAVGFLVLGLFQDA